MYPPGVKRDERPEDRLDDGAVFPCDGKPGDKKKIQGSGMGSAPPCVHPTRSSPCNTRISQEKPVVRVHRSLEGIIAVEKLDGHVVLVTRDGREDDVAPIGPARPAGGTEG